MAKLRITYTKSVIGYSKDQKATVKSLGLHKLNSSVIQDDTPSIRGMAFKVKHLISVDEVDEAALATPLTVKKTTRPHVVAGSSTLNDAFVPVSSAATVDLGSAVAPIVPVTVEASEASTDNL